MDRVGKYGLFIKRISPKDADITKESLETVNNMLVFLAEKLTKQANIIIDQKTLRHDAFLWLLTDIQGELGKHSQDFANSVLYGEKELVFPTKRTENLMRKNTCLRISRSAVKTLTAILEYFCGQIMEASFSQAKKSKRKRIRPIDIEAAISQDKELHSMFGKGVISGR
ncbi:histone 2A-domain-containing protein [Marseillevirus marseillevirus]|uniref:Histone 2A-domain-containing protein n=1 Tax=Marseillevirus marseillevirus TaxID=694581 RepID=D2XAH0_GBMV|nr:histone 2A-domain-containing protein [Marseillevirus marseillevirus]ADB03947.1 histone 2A-domain-containing protein [Marseillevirus marseillevirus]